MYVVAFPPFMNMVKRDEIIQVSFTVDVNDVETNGTLFNLHKKTKIGT